MSLQLLRYSSLIIGPTLKSLGTQEHLFSSPSTDRTRAIASWQTLDDLGSGTKKNPESLVEENSSEDRFISRLSLTLPIGRTHTPHLCGPSSVSGTLSPDGIFPRTPYLKKIFARSKGMS